MALYHQPWPLSPAVAIRLDPSQPIEEENTPDFKPHCFYPARLGQVLDRRYQLATKLGYGSSSTVWLARDLNWLCAFLHNFTFSSPPTVGGGRKNDT